ncbi:unnamed protein product [Rotaria sordida]|uniref:Uncharacterized protein n=1 Tax=Rotaria sordida TaxID=392033 RepID=A0A814W568_9BILA|nr:unnamed protein product [Rotaria sordida]
MARIKSVTSRTGMLLDGNTTRLPLALKPSNSRVSSSSSCTIELLSPITANTDINSTLTSISDPPSLLASSKEKKSSSSIKKMKKTKSQSKAVIIESEADEEDTDIQNGAEAQYDLITSIHECGGIDQFLEAPCMILYKRFLAGQDSVRGVEKIHETKRSSGNAQSEIHSSNKNVKYVQSKNKNDDEEEKSDIENIDGNDSGTMNSRTTELEGEDEKIQVPSASEDEIVEEGTSQTNMPIGDTKRKNINYKGGSKNCGLYMFLNKYQEVKECVNNVLSYGREHGVLMSGVQLKTLLDIQNVEITKNRACAIVELISNYVEVVSNPHFVPPTAQKSLFEYYGDGSELTAVSPAKSIPIPRSIMIEYREEESKKKKTDGDNKRGKEEQEPPLEMKKKIDAENYNSEAATKMMEVDDEKINENQTNSIDNKQNNKKEKKKLNENNSEKGRNISSSHNHLKRPVINNDRESSSDNTGINSTKSPSKIKNVVERCTSPIPGKTHSSITICTERRLSPLSSSWSTVSTNDQISSTDVSHSISPQHSNAADSTTKTSSSLLQQSTPSQTKQTNVSIKKVDTAQTPKDSKRRSYGLRSKAKRKQPQQSPTEHSNTAPPAPPSKKKKIDSSKKSAEKYQILTKQLGKIPKKIHTPSATVTSNAN